MQNTVHPATPPIIRTVNMFCGAGGASLGVAQAISELGFEEESWALNHWETAIATHNTNFPNTRGLRHCLNDLQPHELGLQRGEIDLIWSSPSCTDFTFASAGRPRNEQLRAGPFAVTNWTLGLMPKCVIVENVAEMTLWGPLDENNQQIKEQAGHVFNYWREGFHVAGYNTDFRILDCANYGDPTNRRRLFFIALHPSYGRITWPTETHAENPEATLFGSKAQWLGASFTVEPNIEGKPILTTRTRPLGVNAKRMILEGFEKFGAVNTIIPHPRKRANARPATRPMPTITGTSNDIGICKIQVSQQDGTPLSDSEALPRDVLRPLLHAIEENQTSPVILRFEGQDLTAQATYRMLSVRELARGQSFPDWFQFSGTQEDARLQIGNAVPSQTAKALAKNLLKQVTQPRCVAKTQPFFMGSKNAVSC